MKRAVLLGAFVVLIATGGYGVFCAMSHRDRAATAVPAAGPAAETEIGRPIGAFDPAMSGVCRFSCAAPEAYDPKDVALQPGVAGGRLTQCPVSGVVFVADARRPHVTLVTGDYVLCCNGCARRFGRNPGRYVKL